MEATTEPAWPRLVAVDVTAKAPVASHPGPEQRVAELTEGLYALLAEAVEHPQRWH